MAEVPGFSEDFQGGGGAAGPANRTLATARQKQAARIIRSDEIRLDATRSLAISNFVLCNLCEGGAQGCSFGIEAENFFQGAAKMSGPANAELQRLLRLLSDTATKAEQEAYAAGWRDCRAAMLKALSGITDRPQGTDSVYAPISDMNGSAESTYTN